VNSIKNTVVRVVAIVNPQKGDVATDEAMQHREHALSAMVFVLDKAHGVAARSVVSSTHILCVTDRGLSYTAKFITAMSLPTLLCCG
jgi:hypothetical protein